MKIKLIFIFSILLIFTGCGKKYSITPDRLPTAYVNQEYEQTIKISGGKVVDQYASLKTIIPKELGITIQPIIDLDGYNILEIKGTPKYKGGYTLMIKAEFFGGTGANINKTYTFKIE